MGDHTYYDFTLSLCSTCLRTVYTKIVFEAGCVYMIKTCPEHGREKTLISTDPDYYRRCRNFVKPGDSPKRFANPVHHGCPFDCGLCADHEQHSCVTLVEITDRCNLSCPTCYAGSGPGHGRHRSLDEIESMLDTAVASEGAPDVVQISGGEPTLHPRFFDVLDRARERPIKHLMVDTNGIRIAREPAFAKRLASYGPGFEVYLQFDSREPSTLEKIRGVDLRETRETAIARLNELGLSTTLVVTLERSRNLDEVGTILDYAMAQPCVRGVTFQPTQEAGRRDGFDPRSDPCTLSEVRDAIATQSRFTRDDMMPVPCNPDVLAMGYALKTDDGVVPLTRHLDPNQLLASPENTIVYEHEILQSAAADLFRTSTTPSHAADCLNTLLCCLPGVATKHLTYEDVFRVLIVRFMDARDFDVRVAKRSCVQFAQPDGQMIPFETMNLLYRHEIPDPARDRERTPHG